MFTCSNGYWEVYRHFQGDFFGLGVGDIREDLSLEEYVMGEVRFNEKGAGYSSITIKKKQ